jgi:methylenetetrahydrofolate--tRNA-(uracil-5-)-methyltransferase
LTVDRDVFVETVSRAIKSHPNITVLNEEASSPPAGAITVIASGPLTSQPLFNWLDKNTAAGSLYFYDAIAPVVDAASIEFSEAFLANRYDKGGEEAYLNCPVSEERYYSFVDALLTAEKVAPRSFEKEIFFQGCQPIEAIAMGGRDSLRFGPMKPVGLTDPKTGKQPFAVIQLRPENKSKTAYNLVGFQTKLRYSEQQSVLRLIPALQKAEFLRYGSMHRNTYVCAPDVLRPDLSLKGHPLVYLAGQITGVEGYVESAASGLLAAIFVLQRLRKQPHSPPPGNTAFGALLKHVTASDGKTYQPSNVHFGLFEASLFIGVAGLKRDEARRAMAEQAKANLKQWWDSQ